MPELPEVETTRRGIDAVITGRKLARLVIHEARMRWPIPPDLPGLLAGREVLECARRGKYLLLRFEHGTQIVHLGMSGSLRSVAPANSCASTTTSNGSSTRRCCGCDPRRFGAVLWHAAGDGPIEAHPLLAKLGIEPFDPRFDGAWLHRHFQRHGAAIKQVLLAGAAVVGVGNIYASESLFRARISPKTPANKLSPARCDRLAECVRATLADALTSGGSTLRDYVGATGEPGAYFEIHAAVYEREGQPCRVCGTPIKRIVQGQRATYYCPKCQKV